MSKIFVRNYSPLPSQSPSPHPASRWKLCNKILIKYNRSMKIIDKLWHILVYMLHLYGTDLFCPSHPPFEWLKTIFLSWLKLNFRNGFGCWNLTHHLIRQSRSFFEQKMGCRTLKWVPTSHPKLGVFSYFLKYTFIVALIS